MTQILTTKWTLHFFNDVQKKCSGKFAKCCLKWLQFELLKRKMSQSIVKSLFVLISLKAVDTIGNCQRLTFTGGVSQHMHKITNLWKLELNFSSNVRLETSNGFLTFQNDSIKGLVHFQTEDNLGDPLETVWLLFLKCWFKMIYLVLTLTISGWPSSIQYVKPHWR